MIKAPHAGQYGFLRLPADPSNYYCWHCYKLIRAPKVGDLRKHKGSSYCAFRIATGIATADKTRLGLSTITAEMVRKAGFE